MMTRSVSVMIQTQRSPLRYLLMDACLLKECNTML